jgi:hypothetical protein
MGGLNEHTTNSGWSDDIFRGVERDTGLTGEGVPFKLGDKSWGSVFKSTSSKVTCVAQCLRRVLMYRCTVAEEDAGDDFLHGQFSHAVLCGQSINGTAKHAKAEMLSRCVRGHMVWIYGVIAMMQDGVDLKKEIKCVLPLLACQSGATEWRHEVASIPFAIV